MFQPPAPRVREVKHRGVIGPVRHAKERMVLMSDALHVLDEGLKSLFVGPMATAVPPLEVVRSSSNRVRDRRVGVYLHDAVKGHVSADG